MQCRSERCYMEQQHMTTSVTFRPTAYITADFDLYDLTSTELGRVYIFSPIVKRPCV